MLHFSQRKNIMLKEDDKEKFYLVASDKHEIDEIQNKIDESTIESDPLFNCIQVSGLSSKASHAVANKFIPIIRTVNKKEVVGNSKIPKYEYWTETEFKCYAAKDKLNYNSILTHEEPLSALKCAIQCIGNPEYVYIIKVSKKEVIEETNQIKKYEDSSGDTSICEESTNE